MSYRCVREFRMLESQCSRACPQYHLSSLGQAAAMKCRSAPPPSPPQPTVATIGLWTYVFPGSSGGCALIVERHLPERPNATRV